MPELRFVLCVPDFFVEVPFLSVSSDFLAAVCELLADVVVAVSVVFVQETTKATPMMATMHARRDFFIRV